MNREGRTYPRISAVTMEPCRSRIASSSSKTSKKDSFVRYLRPCRLHGTLLSEERGSHSATLHTHSYSQPHSHSHSQSGSQSSTAHRVPGPAGTSLPGCATPLVTGIQGIPGAAGTPRRSLTGAICEQTEQSDQSEPTDPQVTHF